MRESAACGALTGGGVELFERPSRRDNNVYGRVHNDHGSPPSGDQWPSVGADTLAGGRSDGNQLITVWLLTVGRYCHTGKSHVDACGSSMWTTQDPHGVAGRCGCIASCDVAALDDLAQAFRRAERAVPVAERAAEARMKAAREARNAARLALAEGIVEAWHAGTSQAEIARRTGYSREQVRRILRAHGVEPD